MGFALALACVVCVASLLFARERGATYGGAQQPVTVAQHTTRVQLGLARVAQGELAQVSGRVLDGARGVAGALVCASCVACEATSAPPAPCVYGDHDGRYAFRQLTRGGHYVAASARGYLPGSARAGEPIYVQEGQQLNGLDIALVRGGARVRGDVVDATGGPIAHARVRALRLSPPRLSLDVVSDADGHFELWVRPGFIELAAEAEGYARARQRTTAPTDVELRLVPGGSIAGSVVRAGSGEPVANVDVRAAPPENPQLAMAPGALSDAQGRFVITGLEPAAYLLRARAERTLGMPAQTIELGVAEQRSGIVIEVQDAAEVGGRVSIAQDRGPCRQGMIALGAPSPVQPEPSAEELVRYGGADAVARAVGPEQVAEIQADGSVHFPGVPPGFYFVNVQCFSHRLASGPRLLRVGDQPITGLEWTVAAGAELALQVVDERGRPLPEVEVVLEHPSATSHVISAYETDERGRCEVDGLAPGAYRAYAGDQEQSAVALELAPGHKLEATLRLAGSAMIVVEVVDEHDRPLDGLSVHARPHASEQPHSAGAITSAQAPAAGTAVRHSALPLGAGRYRLGPLAAGSYALGADDGINPPLAAGEDQQGTVVTVAAGATLQTRLVLARGGAITGSVVDAQHNPLADIWVSVKPQLNPGAASMHTAALAEARPLRVLSDHDGRFTLHGLQPAARFDLRALAPYGSGTVVRGVTPGTNVEVVLPEPATIAGVAVDEAGRPLTALRVSAVSRAADSRQTRTFFDPQGRFSLPAVAPGPIELELSSADGRGARVELELAPGQRAGDLQLKLEPAAPATSAPAPPER